MPPLPHIRRFGVGRVAPWGMLLASSAVALFSVDANAGDPQADVEFFEREVRPLLVQKCYECHSTDADILQGGLRLDSRAGVTRGGDSGPAVVPGQPDESLLIQAVRHEAFEMPPSGILPADKIAVLEEWVRRGAPMPPDAIPEATGAGDGQPTIDIEAGREFWSFRPLQKAVPPDVRGVEWSAGPIDTFVLAELERQGLTPSAEADRRTLIRRAYYDLIGLPPAPEEVEAFVADDASDAYARLIDRLLASPHYGERWGRHWLDLARYSDATASWLDSIAQAWLYRDWIVAALNDDMPYDAFVRYQLAADHLPESRPADIAALGFLGLSPVYWKELKLDKEVIKGTVAEEWEERIDAIGRTFLGLTLACARCHDHKFDPITTEDYYSLAGVLASTRLTDRPVIPEAEYAVVRSAREQVASFQEQIKKLAAAKPVPEETQRQINELRRQIAEIERTTPHYHAPTAHAVDDAALYVEADGPNATKLTYKPGESRDLHVQIRGNPSKLGPLVPRRFLEVLSDGTPRPLNHGSGRLDLADAIVTDAAPLAARVIVNRVWAHHFGRGLVETTSDFGSQGSLPTHPELLEYLSVGFVEHGWSLKWLHREIMLSATYRQRSDVPQDDTAAQTALQTDPENRYLWRMNRQRLEVEVWRDAMLAAAGTLDHRIGGPPSGLRDADNVRRSIYGRVDRYELDGLLRLYDFPDPLGHSPGRTPTVTPLQQLFVLNGPFMRRTATLVAERVTAESPGDTEARIRCAYALLFGRPPAEVEVRLGTEFLAGGAAGQHSAESWRQYAQVLLGSNEFLFVD